jgi:hypothetical protein
MEIGNNGDISVAQSQSHNGLTLVSPLAYHLLDHEYGQTPQYQIIRRPTAAPPRTEVCSCIGFQILCEAYILDYMYIPWICV